MSKDSTATDLIIKLPASPDVATFTNPDEFDKLYDKIQEAVKQHVPDVTTRAGRDEIASLAYKVARTKTALDVQGKALTDEWRESTKKVNDVRNVIKDRLDALKDSVRKPLDDWEAAEKARVESHKGRLANLIALSKIGLGHSSDKIRGILAEAEKTELGTAVWEEFAPQAQVARDDAIGALTTLLAAAEKQEADAAELEAFRVAKVERDRQDAERVAAEEREKAEALRFEKEREAAERRKAELAAAAEEAAKRVERENAERVAAAERQAKEAKERAEREIAEAARRAEQAKAEELEEQKRREANIAHRKKVNNAAASAIAKSTGITVEQAQAVVTQIVSGLVPNVTLKY